MAKYNINKLLCLVLCIVLAAAMAACGGSTVPSESTPSSSAGTPADSTPSAAAPETTAPTDSTVPSDVIVKGEGKIVFKFNVLGKDGKEVKFEIHTDKTSVGEALQEVDLIQGEMGDYGLYVKTVNGETLDYNKDQMYWAFYVDGQYALKSADQTEINPDSVYLFKAEKAS